MAPDLFILGEAPFTYSSAPVKGQYCFYLNDFFLRSSTPWLIPAETYSITKENFLARFRDYQSFEGDIDWRPVNTKHFEEAFISAKRLFQAGEIQKIIPVVFEEGTIPKSWGDNTLEILTVRQISSTDLSYAFGFVKDQSGCCGVTPEVLFSSTNKKIETAALAGTKDALLGVQAIDNYKDSREHSLVIDDISNQLLEFGTVSIGPTTPDTIATLIHLRTPISVSLSEKADFDTIVGKLHPTAALGVYPRGEATRGVLEGLDKETNREVFGAPFGIQTPGGDGFCLVAIRCVQWTKAEARLGSGCGLIEESVLKEELAELALKRDSVKSRLHSPKREVYFGAL